MSKVEGHIYSVPITHDWLSSESVFLQLRPRGYAVAVVFCTFRSVLFKERGFKQRVRTWAVCGTAT